MQQSGIDFTSSSFTLPVLKLSGTTLADIAQQLKQHVQHAPSLFENMALVADLSRVDPGVDLLELMQLIRDHHLNPLGIRNAHDAHKIQAKCHGIALLNPSRGSSGTTTATKVVRRSVRSGQQIYAQGGDLVIIGSVSNGAEVIADGSIQILGTLRGRAIAGANGQHNASIVCANQQAELLSIGGYFWLTEQIDQAHWQQGVMATQQQGQLTLDPINF
ncbi:MULTISPECIES: septum site-determining protein MinC [Ferrimonas]|uniref:septum site-determining protein MinC n=1 Tax=Ferrimonas TaxID=44011 RepID=UPI000415154D|nr:MULTISPECIES: septum site-determining protein MinC [Ferrimonas]USD39309.1 septum site-determining protein MinC [Ferrimonas sp. SCSIO 43195]